jgi:hypothetical protein
VLSGRGDWCPRLSVLTVWASGAARVDNSWCVACFLGGGFVFAIFWSFGLFGFVWGVFSCCHGDVTFADLSSDSSQVWFSCSPIVLALVPLIVVPHHREGWSVVVVDIYKEWIAELVPLVEFTN